MINDSLNGIRNEYEKLYVNKDIASINELRRSLKEDISRIVGDEYVLSYGSPQNRALVPYVTAIRKDVRNEACAYFVLFVDGTYTNVFTTLSLITKPFTQTGGDNYKGLSKNGKESLQSTLLKAADIFREELRCPQGFIPGQINLNPKGTNAEIYQYCCIYSSCHSISDLPGLGQNVIEQEILAVKALAESYYDRIESVNDRLKKALENRNEQMPPEVEPLAKETISWSDLSPKETIAHINSYISSKGFSYDPGLVENFYLCLKSKPFVILAGISGTGKTKLVKLFSEAIGAEYKLVPVRPDWSDSSDLFGHVDLNGKFIEGAIIGFIAKAAANPDRPYILCFDEMNLARVEYYFSDFLSVMETRTWDKGGVIVSDPLITMDKYGEDRESGRKYGELKFPENLYIVGTVNMDETTFPFSKKVLDRANTIEFNKVNLNASLFGDSAGEVEPLRVKNDFLRSRYIVLKDCEGDDEFVSKVCSELQKINEILSDANLHVGFRVRDEIAFYALNNKKNELISANGAIDNQILQKILPRIQGSSESVRKVLCELFRYIAGSYKENDDSDSKAMAAHLKDPGIKYPKSAGKIQMMVQRIEEDGFTSYWL